MTKTTKGAKAQAADKVLQVANIETTSDSTATLVLSSFEVVGTNERVLRRGKEIVLFGQDESRPFDNEFVLAFNAEQARYLAKQLNIMADEIKLPF